MQVYPRLSVVDIVKKVITKDYCNYRDRSRRAEFWYFSLVASIIIFILELPLTIFASNQTQEKDYQGNVKPVELSGGLYAYTVIIFFVIFGLIFLPTLSLSVRRLHDIGRSGCWLWILLIPGLGEIVLIIFWILDSEPNENNWGASPKYAQSAALNPTPESLGQV